jgi:gamma-glutamyltranspeptidase
MRTLTCIILFFCASWLFAGCESSKTASTSDASVLEAGSIDVDWRDDRKTPDQLQLKHALIATYHSAASEAGMSLLRRGGNAFDAFVAATFVQYVPH